MHEIKRYYFLIRDCSETDYSTDATWEAAAAAAAIWEVKIQESNIIDVIAS